MQDHNSLSLTCFLSVCYHAENQSISQCSTTTLCLWHAFWVSVTVLKTNPINQSMQYHNSRSVTHFALLFSYDLFPSFHFNSGAHAVEKGEISCQHIPFPFCPLQLAPTVQKGTLTAKVFIHSYRTCRWYETMDILWPKIQLVACGSNRNCTSHKETKSTCAKDSQLNCAQLCTGKVKSQVLFKNNIITVSHT